MQNVITSGRLLSLALFVLALAMPTTIRASERFEGAWAKTARECGDKDGPNSLTIIDLKVNIDGKPVPMVEQYENHCGIDSKSTVANDKTLSVTCFEFWDDFKKKVNARKTTIKLSTGPSATLKIDGKSYRRCRAKGAPGQARPEDPR